MITDLGRAVEVILVRSPACQLCDDAERALAEVARDHSLSIRRVELTSDEGRTITRTYRAPMAPIVLVGGDLLGWGRLSRGKLRRRLAELEATAR